jgi:polyisoprenoid-binding protein YceI
VALKAGKHKVGRADGLMQVRTYREGMAQKVGHDLIIEVVEWTGTVDVGEDGTVRSVALEADPRSLHVREGLRGLKPVSDRDRREIRKNIDNKILGGKPIEFHSTSVQSSDSHLTVDGELALAGSSRPASFELDVGGDGHVTGTLPLTQSNWGIKPYRGMMGALKVRDDLEIVFDVELPAG